MPANRKEYHRMGLWKHIDIRKIERYFRYLLMTAVCLVGVWLVAAQFQGTELPSVKISSEPSGSLEEGWYHVVDGHQVPLKEPKVEVRETTGYETAIYHRLPEVTEEESLLFYNDYQGLAVYIGETCIYDYGYDTKPAVGSMVGNFACMVPMKAEYSGQTMEIRIRNPLKSGNRALGFRSVYLDHKKALILDVILANADQLLCAFLFQIVSIAVLGIYLVEWIRKRGYEKRNLLYLGTLILLSAAWIWTDSSLPQLLWRNGLAVGLVSFLVFMLLPIPALGLIGTICPRGRGMIRLLQNIALVNILVQSILYMKGIMNYPTLLPITHMLLVVDFVAVLLLLWEEVKRTGSKYAKGILGAFVILLVCSLSNLAVYYGLPSSDNSRYFRHGFVVFIVILYALSFSDMMNFIEEKAEVKLYKRLAYTDLMTKLKNRVAYERYIAELLEKEGHGYPLTFVMMDVNNLKPVNDNYGHDAGDEILKGAAECIQRTFGGLGQIFRIGGDEFFVAADRNDLDMDELTKRLSDEVEMFNGRCSYPLSLACGYADNRDNPSLLISQLLKLADMHMYENKTELKSKKVRWNSFTI